jgi:hypothetical protein
MLGRETRGRHNTRGRGGFERGGRGYHRPARTGTVPAIGAYLDIVNPGWLTTWMRKMGEYAMAQYQSKVHQIFGANGTLGNYPDLLEPPDPEDGATRVDQKKWELAYAEWRKETLKLEQDQVQLYGLMLGQMSDESKNRIKETEDGAESMETNNPLQLLSAIISTHMTDNRLGAEHNAYKIGRLFRQLVMMPGEQLSSYYHKFTSLYSGYQEAYRRADEEMPDSAFEEGQNALQFTMGLNSTYNVYKQYYEDSLKPWPESIFEAYQEASKFKPKREDHNAGGPGRANAFAMSGRGRGRNRGRHGGRGGREGRGRYQSNQDSSGGQPGSASEYGTRAGECYQCGETGHYKWECKAKQASGATSQDSSGQRKEK